MVEVLMATDNHTAALPHLTHCLTHATSHHLHYLAAMTTLHLAVVQVVALCVCMCVCVYVCVLDFFGVVCLLFCFACYLVVVADILMPFQIQTSPTNEQFYYW